MAEHRELESDQGSLCTGHPERSGWFAKRSSHAVEACPERNRRETIAGRRYQRLFEGFPRGFGFALDRVAGLNQSFLRTFTLWKQIQRPTLSSFAAATT